MAGVRMTNSEIAREIARQAHENNAMTDPAGEATTAAAITAALDEKDAKLAEVEAELVRQVDQAMCQQRRAEALEGALREGVRIFDQSFTIIQTGENHAQHNREAMEWRKTARAVLEPYDPRREKREDVARGIDAEIRREQDGEDVDGED